MPLFRIDLIEGRTDEQIQLLLDACHEATVEAFAVPARDRYQIVSEHAPGRMRIEDTGLNIPRTNDVVLIQVFSSPRTRDQKEAFYHLLVDKLGRQCGIAPSDVMISITSNTKEDWSFGHGRAQFLTGEL